MLPRLPFNSWLIVPLGIRCFHDEKLTFASADESNLNAEINEESMIGTTP